MRFTSETLRRSLRTFFQTFFGAVAVAIPTVDWQDEPKKALLFLLAPCISSAIAAVMNMEESEEG